MVHEVTSTCVPVSYLIMGMLDNNVYIIDDGEGCFVVDPSCDAERILDAIGGRKVDALVATHGHWDHIGALADLREATGAPVIASAIEAPFINGEKQFDSYVVRGGSCPVDRTVDDGDILEIGNTRWQVIATPGHTLGGICLFCEPVEGQEGAPVLVSGDTLFKGTHGRVDFKEGDIDDMRESLKRLAALPKETVVLPGHSGLTTIGLESGWLKLCCL